MDQTAFRVFVRQHDGFVRSVIRPIIKNDTDMDEVMSRVWWNVWRAIDRFDYGTKVEAWLTRIATNAALDLLRWKKRRARVEVELEDCHNGEDVTGASHVQLSEYLRTGSPEELLKGFELEREMQLILNELPAEFQETLRLRIQHDASYEEIKRELALPSVGTVMSRLHRARKLVAQCLKELEGELPEEQT